MPGAGIDETWLNDAVKGYLSPRGEFDLFLELPHLKEAAPGPRQPGATSRRTRAGTLCRRN
jgi:hypothetical protein